MSYELLLKPQSVWKKPWKLMLMAILVSSVGIFVAYGAFSSHASVILITFTVIPLVPIMVKIIEYEETNFIKKGFHHHKIFWVYMFLFLGLMISYSAWYFFLPDESSHAIFDDQKETLYSFTGIMATYNLDHTQNCMNQINQDNKFGFEITNCKKADVHSDGNEEMYLYTNYGREPSFVYMSQTGELKDYHNFISKIIIVNNLKVLLLMFLTSIILGAGALYLLVWNASIIGIYIGEVAHNIQHIYLLSKFPSFLLAFPTAIFKLFLHGIPEIAAYFIGAVAGGILSVAVIKHRPFDDQFRKICIDSLLLFMVSVGLIFISGIIEAY